jgi:glucan biosynthesis protein C
MLERSTMTTTALSATRTVAAVQTRAATRMLFIDNLRVFLTILVILHHLMIIYTGAGSFLYTEGRQDTISAVLGTWFCAANQAYFMGFFLLIAAYFVPGSYDRKGAGQFLKDRLIRLGIPLIVYSWIISPLTWMVITYVTKGYLMPLSDYFPGAKFEGIIGAGPLWFVEALLIFTVVYVAWRKMFRPVAPVPPVQFDSRFPGSKVIALFAVLMGLATFVVRLWLPVDWKISLLNLQIPFFVQYIALFVVGLIAYRRNWLTNLSDSTGKRWLAIAIVLVLLFVPMALAGGALETGDGPFKGGWHWQAMAYALWESFVCVGMCIGLTYLFRRHWNQQGCVAKFLSPNAYTAYIIHAPVITFTALALRNVEVYPLLKFGLAAVIALPLCFLLSNLIRKLPYTDRVL